MTHEAIKCRAGQGHDTRGHEGSCREGMDSLMRPSRVVQDRDMTHEAIKGRAGQGHARVVHYKDMSHEHQGSCRVETRHSRPSRVVQDKEM